MTSSILHVAGYIRKSTRGQAESEDRQLELIEGYAERAGVKLVGIYTDPGVSGTKTRRPQLDRMLRDAKAGKFDEVIITNFDRLSRAEQLRANEIFLPLAECNVRIRETSGLEYDLRNRTTQTMVLLQNHRSHEESIAKSKHGTEGKMRAARAGKWLGSAPPYGFDRLWVDPRTGEEKRRGRLDPGAKPPGWEIRFAINEEEAEVVRWIFRQFASLKMTRARIARDLNERCVPCPGRIVDGEADRSRGWVHQQIHKILQNPAYRGTIAAGRSASGKFNRFGDGELESIYNEPAVRERAAKIEVDGACPAIVDQKLWDAAQAGLRRLKESPAPKRGRRGAGEVSKHPLSGIAICGGCGAKLCGVSRRGYVQMRCQNASTNGRCETGGIIRERDLLPNVILAMRRMLTDAELRAKQPSGPDKGPSAASTIERRITEIKAEIDAGRKRWIEVADPELQGLLEKTLSERLGELKRLEDELQRAKVDEQAESGAEWFWSQHRADAERLVEMAADASWNLMASPAVEEFRKAFPQADVPPAPKPCPLPVDVFRQLARELNLTATVYWTVRQTAQKKRRDLSRVAIRIGDQIETEFAQDRSGVWTALPLCAVVMTGAEILERACA